MSVKTKIKKSEIKSGKARSYIIGEAKIVVCNVDGKYYAVEDVCSHDDGELVSGEADLLEACQLQCPRHGARFNVKTGEAKRMPAVAPISTYKVTEIEEELEVVID
ncbi:MAG: Rieske 2Fe-2S domain-containing protein [Candidatus Melainabacteria bacterium]|nr:Rieske 2Fe-2S domain-containing protein [Candidatus Melainabacteria bacterium]MBI3309019.1 Rieske 2Fe-2S domain-containing protein [Candidatus Melainabacteria bacterium]